MLSFFPRGQSARSGCRSAVDKRLRGEGWGTTKKQHLPSPLPKPFPRAPRNYSKSEIPRVTYTRVGATTTMSRILPRSATRKNAERPGDCCKSMQISPPFTKWGRCLCEVCLGSLDQQGCSDASLLEFLC